MSTTLIEVPAWGNVNLIEVVWLAAGLLAIVFTCAHIPPLWRDWRLAGQTGQAILRVVAWSYLRREYIRLAQGACLTSIGVYAAIQPSALPGKDVVSIVGLVLTGVLLALSLLVSVQSHLDWNTRTEVQKLLAAEELLVRIERQVETTLEGGKA